MATFKQIPEEGRPPDSPGGKRLNRKLRSHTSISPWHNNPSKHPYHSNASTPNGILNKNHSECNNNNVFEVKASIVEDLNKNVQESKKKCLAAPSASNKSEKSSLKQSLPKLLCLKKSPSVSQDKAGINALKTLNVNALRLDNVNLNRNYYTVDESASKTLDNSNLIKNDCDRSSASSSSQNDNSLSERAKNRNSFHQNVEEALSSLLWQPYEYQNNGKSHSITSSSCSSPSSSLGDLDEITKNDGTSQHCSFTDLHLPTSTSEMVINLPAKNLVDQSGASPRSCDAHTIRPTSWLSEVFSLTEVSGERVVSGEVNAVSDVSKSGDMQLNVSSSAPSVPQSNVLNISTAENGLRGNVTIQSQQNVYQKQNNLNLSSANVVGLPNHARYSSVPVSTIQSRPTGNTIFPNHVRNISEPSNQFVKYQNNNSPSQQGNVVPNHQRHSSQVDQSNLHQISHFRSSSVPKSMPIVPRHESSTNTTTTAVPSAHVNNTRLSHKLTPQIHNNVSNVNVNFYRAVPVNVVSSVPTIHCLNTLSNVQGNSVSNVQVLPLGTSFQSQNNNGSQSHFPVTTVNSSTAYSNLSTSCTSGTTQVILHNTQANTNSIHIPSTYQNVNRNTLLNPQVVPVQLNNRSTVNTSTNTIANFFPPPPVTLPNQEIIQSSRPISTSSVVPMVTVQQNSNDARPSTYSNAGINTTPPNGNTQQINPSNPQNKPNNEVRTARTFTSTEAQTDEISVLPPVNNELSSGNREQRRRERRERRHQRRINSASHRHTADGSTQINNLQNDRLPDILNSHLPPPYTTLPNGMPPQSVMASMPPMVPPPQMVPPQMMPPPHGAVLQTVVPNNVVPPSGFVFPGPPQVVQGQVPLVQGPTPVAVPVQPPSGFRFPFPANGFRRGRFAEEPPKGCCGLLSWKPGSLRWFIALIALVAVCCVLFGTALGAIRPAGRDHLTVSLLMIGVGIVLVTVSGVAWRLTSHDSSTCRSMLGLGSTESVDVCARRFVPRLPPSYGRPHHPYAAMMYPEFQYRPPPPSYQASMQEYRLRLLLLDRGNTPQIQAGIQNAVSPPPTYRSHAGSLLRAPLSSRRDASQSEYSCPPSYRSQNSSNRPGTLQSNSVLHSREQSLSLSESNHGGSVVNVVSILGSTEEDIALDNITLDSLKMEPETEINPVKMLLKSGSGDLEGSKDGNLVTIVQTSDQSPVIVTVSGSSQIDNSSSVQITEIPSEMEILAHL